MLNFLSLFIYFYNIQNLYISLCPEVSKNTSQNQEEMIFLDIKEEQQKDEPQNIKTSNFFFPTEKLISNSLNFAQSLKPISQKIDQSINQQKPSSALFRVNKAQKSSSPLKIPKNRLNNYVFPNLIREVKHCLFKAFSTQNKKLYEALVEFYNKIGIKFQVWAFDAILVSLIYLRDKSKLITEKKYSAIIGLISSNLAKNQCKFTSKPFHQKQIQFLHNQYQHCINHLKVYNNQNIRFSSLLQNSRNLKMEFFQNVVLKRKLLIQKFLQAVHNVQTQLDLGILQKIITDKQKSYEKIHKDEIFVQE